MKKKIVVVLMLLVASMAFTACGKFTCYFCGEDKFGKKYTSAWSDEIEVCDDCYKEIKEMYDY